MNWRIRGAGERERKKRGKGRTQCAADEQIFSLFLFLLRLALKRTNEKRGGKKREEDRVVARSFLANFLPSIEEELSEGDVGV